MAAIVVWVTLNYRTNLSENRSGASIFSKSAVAPFPPDRLRICRMQAPPLQRRRPRNFIAGYARGALDRRSPALFILIEINTVFLYVSYF
jgi:hypothetical protein